MMQGKISTIDAAAGTITLTSRIGSIQVIKGTADTTIESQVTITVSELKVGDEVQVQGIPTGISADTITAGSPPAFMMGGRGRRSPGGFVPAPGRAGPLDANGNPVPQGPPPANAVANGKVVSTTPLTISVAENMDVVLRLARDGKISRYAPIPFSKLKIGDAIMAMGTIGQDGSFTATSIGVNMSQGGGAVFTPGRPPRGLGAQGILGGPGGAPGGRQ